MKTGEPEFLVDYRGKKKAVVVPLAEYRRMIEDLHDLAVIAERRSDKPISIGEMKRLMGR